MSKYQKSRKTRYFLPVLWHQNTSYPKPGLFNDTIRVGMQCSRGHTTGRTELSFLTLITKRRSAKYPCRLGNVFHSPQELQNVQKFCPDIRMNGPAPTRGRHDHVANTIYEACWFIFIFLFIYPHFYLNPTFHTTHLKTRRVFRSKESLFSVNECARQQTVSHPSISKCGDGKMKAFWKQSRGKRSKNR